METNVSLPTILYGVALHNQNATRTYQAFTVPFVKLLLILLSLMSQHVTLVWLKRCASKSTRPGRWLEKIGLVFQVRPRFWLVHSTLRIHAINTKFHRRALTFLPICNN